MTGPTVHVDRFGQVRSVVYDPFVPFTIPAPPRPDGAYVVTNLPTTEKESR